MILRYWRLKNKQLPIMKKAFLYLLIASISTALSGQAQQFVAKDIDNFWAAFDKITATKDSAAQYQYLKNLYLDQGTEGLKSLIQVRNYQPKEFIDAIKLYPKFWQSLRANSLNTQAHYPEIEADIAKLKNIYPPLKPATLFFLIGAFRTNGTILENRVLIGAELALGDETTVIEEFPEFRQNFFREHQPKRNLALLCTHEYVHTQQREPVEDLLSYCIYEGVAEYISCLATGKASNTPAIAFGKANQTKVIDQFLKDLHFGNLYNWLWGENRNELKIRDLGYYIGYEICERYCNMASDKTQAIKDLIELDYTKNEAIERIVDQSKLLPKPLSDLKKEYDAQRPSVLSVAPFNNKRKKVKPGIIPISITFSEEMDVEHRGFEFGPLGAEYAYEFHKIVGWSNQNRTFTIEVKVKPNRKYQTVISTRFRNKQGFRLQPFLVEFETTK